MIEKVGVGCFFGAGGCFFRVVVMVGCTGGLLNVIEKVGLVDFIEERSSAILSFFLSFSLLSIFYLSIENKNQTDKKKFEIISYIYKLYL